MGTRMPKVKCALVDLSGTLHVEDEAVLGAQDALKRLREQVPIVRFVTNTTKESKRLLHGRLIRLGFDVRPEEMFTSLTMARTVVEKRLRAGGSGRLPLLLVDDQALEDFAGLGTTVEEHGEHNREFDCVVVGLAPDKLNYDRMNQAFRSLRSGASLVAVHKARYYRRKDGLALGPGPFVRALEYASGVKAEVCGKPEKNFFLSALDGTGCSPAEAVMIGDDVRDDVLGAQNAGLVGILVQTGKYVEGDDEKYGRPDFCVRDFVEAVDAICHS